jgi:hypothetical protein
MSGGLFIVNNDTKIFITWSVKVAVVGHLAKHPNVEGLNPAFVTGTRREKISVKVL